MLESNLLSMDLAPRSSSSFAVSMSPTVEYFKGKRMFVRRHVYINTCWSV